MSAPAEPKQQRFPSYAHAHAKQASKQQPKASEASDGLGCTTRAGLDDALALFRSPVCKPGRRIQVRALIKPLGSFIISSSGARWLHWVRVGFALGCIGLRSQLEPVWASLSQFEPARNQFGAGANRWTGDTQTDATARAIYKPSRAQRVSSRRTSLVAVARVLGRLTSRRKRPTPPRACAQVSKAGTRRELARPSELCTRLARL